MKSRERITLGLLVLVAAVGCASNKVSNRQTLVAGKIPRPDHILVYDFVGTSADVPADSSITGQYSEQSQTADQIAIGRQVGATIATQLVEEIRAMGLPAQRASRATPMQINDIVIRGYLVSVDEGSAVKRVAIGFGSGASELKTAVEGYQMTPQGLRKLGSGTVDSSGAKSPGAAAPLAIAVASGNPAGLIVSSGVKVYGEASGSSTIEGRAKQTAKEIGEQLKPRFQQQGWIK